MNKLTDKISSRICYLFMLLIFSYNYFYVFCITPKLSVCLTRNIFLSFFIPFACKHRRFVVFCMFLYILCYKISNEWWLIFCVQWAIIPTFVVSITVCILARFWAISPYFFLNLYWSKLMMKLINMLCIIFLPSSCFWNSIIVFIVSFLTKIIFSSIEFEQYIHIVHHHLLMYGNVPELLAWT